MKKKETTEKAVKIGKKKGGEKKQRKTEPFLSSGYAAGEKVNKAIKGTTD